MNKVIWLTGLSGAGKTTLAKTLAKVYNCRVIDGDELRKVQKNVDFTTDGRFKNVQAAIDLCKEVPDEMVVVSLITPLREMRALARQALGDRFVEVYVQCSIKKCIERDVKGLYKKALTGELADFTGISHPYEEPFQPELVVNTEFFEVHTCLIKFLKYLGEVYGDRQKLTYCTDVGTWVAERRDPVCVGTQATSDATAGQEGTV